MSTEPFFLRFTRFIAHPVTIIVILISIFISYHFFDIPVARYFRITLGQRINFFAEDITLLGLGGYYLIIFATFYIIGRFTLQKYDFANKSLFLFLAVLISGIICDSLKMLMGRARPILYFEHGIYGFQYLQHHAIFLSFPSGHATTITALMTALSYFRPRYFFAFIFVAIIVSFSRVLLSAHYLSDIMIGMLLGMVSTIYLHDFLVKYKFLSTQYKS